MNTFLCRVRTKKNFSIPKWLDHCGLHLTLRTVTKSFFIIHTKSLATVNTKEGLFSLCLNLRFHISDYPILS